METKDVILSRHGVRGYRPDRIPEALIREIFDRAHWTPSWRNPRGWHIWVVTGEALQRFKNDLSQKLLEDAPSVLDLDMPGRAWPELCLARTARLMAAQEEADATAGLDSTREDKLTRLGELFGAPCLIVYGVDCSVTGPQGCLDSGAFVQSMCQAANAMGLGTCLMATAVRFPELLHALLPDEAGKLMVVGVALGYADTDAAMGEFPREPVEFDDLVSWVT